MLADASTNLGGGPRASAYPDCICRLYCIGFGVDHDALCGRPDVRADGLSGTHRRPRTPAPTTSRPRRLSSRRVRTSARVLRLAAGGLTWRKKRDSRITLRSLTTTHGGAFQCPGMEEGVRHGRGPGEPRRQLRRSAAGGKTARFKLKMPTSNDYTVYAWWPVTPGNAARRPLRRQDFRWQAVDDGGPDHGGGHLDPDRHLRHGGGRLLRREHLVWCGFRPTRWRTPWPWSGAT